MNLPQTKSELINFSRSHYEQAVKLFLALSKWEPDPGQPGRFREPQFLKDVKAADSVEPAPSRYDEPSAWKAEHWNWFVRKYEPLAHNLNIPPFGLHRVTEKTFLDDLFKFSWEKPVRRQVTGQYSRYELRMFYMEDGRQDIGLAIKLERGAYSYLRWGGILEWKEFEEGFAAQKAGDNT